MQKHYRAYTHAKHTAPKTQQILMLYDAAIRNLQQARDAMEAGRIEERYRLLSKASDIVFGLQGCLDFEKGGEVAQVLYDFYGTIDARIGSLHRTPEPEACAKIAEELKSMRDAWADIDGEGKPSPKPDTPPESVSVTLSA